MTLDRTQWARLAPASVAIMRHDEWLRAHDTLQSTANKSANFELASYAAGRANRTDLVDACAALADAMLAKLHREVSVAAGSARLNSLYRSEAK